MSSSQRWFSDKEVERAVRNAARSSDAAYVLRLLACKALDALGSLEEEDRKTRVRHLRVVADKAIGVERELFHTA